MEWIAFITHIGSEFDAALAEECVRRGMRLYAGSAVRKTAGTRVMNLQPFDPDSVRAVRDAIRREAGRIDMYIDTSDHRPASDTFTIRSEVRLQPLLEAYDANALKPLVTLDAMLPLLDAGAGKRLCFLSSRTASVNQSEATAGYGYRMSKAAFHNLLQMCKNKLAPDGYTLRLFDPAGESLKSEAAAAAAAAYFLARRAVDEDNPERNDERRLALRDAYGREVSW